MRPLTNNERKLSIALGVILLVFGNFFAINWLLQQEKEQSKRREDGVLAVREAESWLAEKTMWLERKKWLDEKQPTLANPEQANSELLQSLQTSARKHQINIIEQALLEPSRQPFYQETSVRIKVTGSLESVVKWMNEIQQPELFQAITSFSIRSDAEPPNVHCELQVGRRYKARENP